MALWMTLGVGDVPVEPTVSIQTREAADTGLLGPQVRGSAWAGCAWPHVNSLGPAAPVGTQVSLMGHALQH